jgi:hypothetical protein
LNEDNEVLFEIKDYDYIVKTMSLLITAYISIPIMMALGMSFEDKGLFSLRTIVVIVLVGTTIFFTFNLYFFKKRKVLFYENKIELKKTFSKSEIITIDVKEVYKILPFNLNSNKERRLYRWNLFRKLVLLLTFPVIIPILCIYAIATYISSFIIFKSFLFDRYRIIVIGKNEKDFLVFYYTGNNELELNIYFRRKLGLEVKKIEPIKGFFIPQN